MGLNLVLGAILILILCTLIWVVIRIERLEADVDWIAGELDAIKGALEEQIEPRSAITTFYGGTNPLD